MSHAVYLYMKLLENYPFAFFACIRCTYIYYHIHIYIYIYSYMYYICTVVWNASFSPRNLGK